MIYLDNAATTKIHARVAEAMSPYLHEYYGNANSLYYDQAKIARKALDDSRKACAELISCKPEEIIFTGSGSESNNMILKGIFFSNPKKNKIITTRVEHSSIIETLRFLETLGAEVCYIEMDNHGVLNLEQFKSMLDEHVGLVTVMYVNNEMGNIFDIQTIGSICQDKEIPFHTDATQAVGKVDFSFGAITGLKLATFSAHKIYGPKGVAVAVIDEELQHTIVPLIHGGEQENGLRGGTHAIHQIVGMGVAANICKEELNTNIKILKEQELVLDKRLKLVFGDKYISNNSKLNKIPGIMNFRIQGMNNQVLLNAMSPIISASSGSACSVTKPSYVLKEFGISTRAISESIRFSLSPYEQYDDFEAIK